jgi:hypothetical protein
VATAVERGGGLRRGSVAGAAAAPRGGSAALGALADVRMADWLRAHGHSALGGVRRTRNRTLGWSALVATGAVLLFTASGPGAGGGAGFWRPLALLARGAGSVSLAVDRSDVRRGERVTVGVTAVGQSSATLWLRAPGERWRALTLELDSAGHAGQVLGPLERDRYLRATSGGRESATLRVRVSLPALLADLQLIARYPEYLERSDQPLAPGPDPIPLPVGTIIETRGRSTLPLRSAAWRRGGASVTLGVEGMGFAGRLSVLASGRWQLDAVPEGAPLEGPPPELNLVAVPDSAPVIVIPVPGADTNAPLSLRQPLVIDARDDHRLTRVELVSRRVSRLGLAGSPPRIDTLPLPEGGPERAVIQWTLDLNGRGFLPGDTAYYWGRALDNAPTPHLAETREYVLRLPSNAELREALRAASRGAAAAADSLAAQQRGLAQSTGELAGERERASDPSRPEQPGSRGAPRGDLPYRSAQRAGQIAEQQQKLLERAQELRDEIKQLSEAAANAGLIDPQWQAELKRLEQLLDRAMTPELAQRLEALRDALQKLDPDALREALKRLAESGQRLKDELSRSRELFQRAALEGSMTTLAQDAQELAQQQRDWNRQAGAPNPDSSLARSERALAQDTDSLDARLAQLEEALQKNAGQQEPVANARRQTQQAGGAMRRAASQAQAGQTEGAQQSGQQAEQALDPVAQQLRQQRDALRQQWRRDVMQTLDHALSETAGLAQREVALSERMRRGEATADVRGEQAALKEGADRVMQRLQSAAGKNALVSPQVGTTLGFARLRMTEAVDRLTRAMPNPQEASALAGQAVDGLNAMAHALLRSRQEVAGAESGSGLEEAIEKMARLAAQQQALNGQAGGMLPLVPLGG